MAISSNGNTGTQPVLDDNTYNTSVIPPLNAAHSLSFWIYLVNENFDGGYHYDIISMWDGSTPTEMHLGYTAWNDDWGIGCSAYSVNSPLGAAYRPKLGMWRKYVTTRASTTLKIFCDGFNPSVSDTDTGFRGAGYGFYAGAGNGTAPSGYRDGQVIVGPIAMWDRTLSDTEAVAESGNRNLMPIIREGLLSIVDPHASKTGAGTLAPIWNRNNSYAPLFDVASSAYSIVGAQFPWTRYDMSPFRGLLKQPFLYFDNLNRADENPIGEPYLALMGFPKLKLYSNRVTTITTGSDHAIRLYSEPLENVWVQAKMVSGAGGSWDCALIARCTDEISGNDMYYADWYANPTNVVHLFKVVGGTWGSSIADGTIAAGSGDIIAMSVQTVSGGAALIKIYVNGVLDVTYLDSSSPLAAGQVGWYIYHDGLDLDDLFATELGAPPNYLDSRKFVRKSSIYRR